ncbi:uncharacterized protein LOC111055167 [Nilaparvata lugens]|uniref:uncharacterized protein LOC111055167 n=1 Tax=Nilaparvata lugens TaxID=108931 RepID=UPI00193DCFBF|nr:uncharacterized protein LOC111055167 [Nilaparvata lugens]
MFGKRTVRSNIIKSSDMKILMDNDEVADGWKQYVESLYGDAECFEGIENEDDVPFDELGPPIAFPEMEKALHDLKSKKAYGVDDIPAELLQALNEEMRNVLFTLLNEIYITGKVPLDSKKSLMVMLPKKSNATRCYAPVNTSSQSSSASSACSAAVVSGSRHQAAPPAGGPTAHAHNGHVVCEIKHEPAHSHCAAQSAASHHVGNMAAAGGGGYTSSAVSQKKRLLAKAQSECMLNTVVTKQEPPGELHYQSVCHGGASCKEPYHYGSHIITTQDQHIVYGSSSGRGGGGGGVGGQGGSHKGGRGGGDYPHPHHVVQPPVAHSRSEQPHHVIAAAAAALSWPAQAIPIHQGYSTAHLSPQPLGGSRLSPWRGNPSTTRASSIGARRQSTSPPPNRPLPPICPRIR